MIYMCIHKVKNWSGRVYVTQRDRTRASLYDVNMEERGKWRIGRKMRGDGLWCTNYSSRFNGSDNNAILNISSSKLFWDTE